MNDFATVGTDMTFTFYQAAIVNKISNLLVCFCSFDLTCAILEKNYQQFVYYIVSTY